MQTSKKLQRKDVLKVAKSNTQKSGNARMKIAYTVLIKSAVCMRSDTVFNCMIAYYFFLPLQTFDAAILRA